MEPLLVKKFSAVPGMNLTDIAERLNAETSENRVACVNWPQQYPECPQVSFRIGHAGDELWLGFKVRESRVLGQQTRIHGDVYMDSCVEFFVSFDNKAYYNLEMNCIGTPHMGYGPGRADRRFVPLPLMQRLEIETSLGREPFAERVGDVTWTLTVRVPIACFAFDALSGLSGRTARANAFKCNSGASVKHYVTWRPVDTPTPDYHRPEFFGDIRFES